MKEKIKYSLCLLMVLAFANLQSQTLTATVNRNTVPVGDRFKLTYTLNDRPQEFYPPNLQNFRVLSGPNQSTSMSVTNGSMTSSTSFSYILSPIKEGQFNLPAAGMKVNGKVINANEVSITVTNRAAASSAQNNGKAQSQQNSNAPNSGNEVKDNCFIRLLVSKNKAYQGEQITATFKIYTRLNIVDNAVDQLPSFTGFYSVDISDQNQGNLRPEVLNGVQYNTAIIKQVVLSPQRTGKIKIEPMSMDLVIRVKDNRRARSVFDQFFGSYKDIEYKAVSNSATIDVSALPSNGKPSSFDGAVGNFELSSTIDKLEVKENEAINLKLKFKGNGNIKLIGDPEIEFPSDFEVYDPKKTSDVKTSLAGVQGSKTFEYLIIPRHAGDFSIPSVSFSYFNPKTKKYVTQNTESYNIKVLRGNGEEASSTGNIRSVSKKDVTMLGRDIRFIKKGAPSLREANTFFIESRLFWLLITLPIVILFFFFLARKRLREMRADIVGMRKRKATKVATKRLELAKRHMDKGDKNAFYEEVFKSLYGYISDKFNLSVSELNKDKIEDTLNENKVNAEVIKSYLNLLAECEMARYAPSAVMSESNLYEAAEKAINNVEEIK